MFSVSNMTEGQPCFVYIFVMNVKVAYTRNPLILPQIHHEYYQNDHENVLCNVAGHNLSKNKIIEENLPKY